MLPYIAVACSARSDVRYDSTREVCLCGICTATHPCRAYISALAPGKHPLWMDMDSPTQVSVCPLPCCGVLVLCARLEVDVTAHCPRFQARCLPSECLCIKGTMHDRNSVLDEAHLSTAVSPDRVPREAAEFAAQPWQLLHGSSRLHKQQRPRLHLQLPLQSLRYAPLIHLRPCALSLATCQPALLMDVSSYVQRIRDTCDGLDGTELPRCSYVCCVSPQAQLP